MINIPKEIATFWALNPALPKLWLEYVPLDQVTANGLPFAQVEMSGFSREPLNCGTCIDTYRVRIHCFQATAPEAFELGQKALTYMANWRHADIQTNESKPEDFATPVEAGKRIVWVFTFSCEFRLMEVY